MRSWFLRGAAVGLALGCVAAVQAADIETFEYGRWAGAASTDDTGAFARCAVTGRFKRASATSSRDVGAAITVDRMNGWTFGFTGGSTEPTDATRYQVAVDGELIVESRPEAAIDQVAVLSLSDPARFMSALRKGHTMTIAGSGDQFDLALAGIARALDWVEGCSKKYASFVPPGREKEAADAAVLRRDIGDLMQSLLVSVDAKNIRVGPPAGVPAFASEDKSLPWRADGLQGEVQVWAGKSAKALADRIITTSTGCARRPAVAAAAPARRPAKPDPIVFERVDCVDHAGARRIALVLMPRPKGGIYLISVQSREPGDPDAVDRLGERLAEAARRSTVR